MKKLIALVLFVGATLSFTSCSSDDNNEIRVQAPIDGAWYADQVTYSYNGQEHNRSFMELRGDDAVYETDILIIKAEKATLKEHKKKDNKETTTDGFVLKDKDTRFIVLDKYSTNKREVVAVTPTELKLKYKFIAREGTEDMIVTYTKVKPEVKK